MKELQDEKKLMDYLDGISNEEINENLRNQGNQLKGVLDKLRNLPQSSVSPKTDERMSQFIEDKSKENKPVVNLKSLTYSSMIAASIILFFFVFNLNSDIKDSYQKLQSNPSKLSFIYNLNNYELNSDDIRWLNNELREENNPNIKVAIIDLLSNYQSRLNKDFFDNLKHEVTPTVQMAYLNSLESSKGLNFADELAVFAKRNDLINSVKSKAENLLGQ